MEHKQVFFDPNAKRSKWLKRSIAGVSVILASLITFFVFSIVGVSIFPSLAGSKHHNREVKIPKPPVKKDRLLQFVYKTNKNKLWNNIEENKNKVNPLDRKTDKIVAAFYATWQETGLHSLRANASKITHVIPSWMILNKDGRTINTRDWNPVQTPHNLDVLSIAKANHLVVMPLISNANGVGFDPNIVHRLLSSEYNQRLLIDSLVSFLKRNSFDGVNIDFENLFEKDYDKLVLFIKQLRNVLTKNNLQLSEDVEDFVPSHIAKKISENVDFLVVMAYDEHDADNDPGPIASLGWFQDVTNRYEKIIPKEKLVFGIGNYSTDWTLKKNKSESMTYQMAVLGAMDNNPGTKPSDIVDYDNQSLTNYYYYSDDDGNDHIVWMLDAVSAFNEFNILKNLQSKGIALWALGYEDPGIWNLIDKDNLFNNLNAQNLTKLDFPFDIDFEGDGEILNVAAYPEVGNRDIETDQNGFIKECYYNKFPSTYVIKREGYVEKKLALTFDDGPSSDYSVEILNVLKKYNVKGTFFLVGENAERYPSIVRRMWNEGHEIGSHTFTHPNLGSVNRQRTILELNTTQRALQGILGRSTLLFRPPYNADAEPVSAEEVRPVVWATELGYYTVGELIDPQDWQLYKVDSSGNQYKRDAQDVVDSIMDQVSYVKGNVILMHDGGGNRANTAKALNILIPELQKKGYQFVLISDLMKKSRNEVMPAFSKQDIFLVGVDEWIFYTIFTIETILSLCFITAIILGISRVIFILLLVFIDRLKNKPVKYDPNYHPFVSVLISAYNEENVIVNTISSILKSAYDKYEIIVVDDGSKDNTYKVVQDNFSSNDKVIIFRQNNSGKAIALNSAIANAKGEILVNLDADTQIQSDTISKLVRNFSNKDIGAAAGNIKVGNKVNILTTWQSIEYITSQNLDRKAYSILNSITVVPGAIGAWRKEAVVNAGGYIPDTLAEDMDLTWRLREGGWQIITENEALAYTEAPENFKSFLKQRFRWSFGTLQCLWKHRHSVFKYDWFGWLALPSLWLFQIFFQIIAPLVDLQIIWTITSYLKDYISQATATGNWQPITQGLDSIGQIGFFYVLFFFVELCSALVAYKIEKEKYRSLWMLFWQRFVYRQMMYLVIWKALISALKGKKQGWGKLQRKGNVTVFEKVNP